MRSHHRSARTHTLRDAASVALTLTAILPILLHVYVEVVLTDLGMPGMRGSDVARAIRERGPGLRVGLVTAWGEEEIPAEEHEAVGFVAHDPFDPFRVRQTLAGIAPASGASPGQSVSA